METQWYETFFTSLAIDFWRAAVPDEVTAAEVDFIARALEVSPPALLLDLPTGSGRHAHALARRGYRVSGVDLSAVALQVARGARGTTDETNPQWLHGDMRQPPPGGPYDGAFCFGNSFGYLTHEDTRGFVRNMLQALRPGARWLIDTGIAAESLLPHLVSERTLEAGGVTYAVRSRYDAWGGRLVQSCQMTRGEERQASEASYGVYTVAEIRRLLEAEGWLVLSALGSLDGRPFAFGDRRLLLLAQRPR
jgi:SAM-dependent methyltransferase